MESTDCDVSSRPPWAVRIIDLFKGAGLTEEQFAELAGFTQPHMNKMLNGKSAREPSMAYFRRMADALAKAGVKDVSPMYLMWGDPSPDEVFQQFRRVFVLPKEKNGHSQRDDGH